MYLIETVVAIEVSTLSLILGGILEMPLLGYQAMIIFVCLFTS
jgi:hypothetical protein